MMVYIRDKDWGMGFRIGNFDWVWEKWLGIRTGECDWGLEIRIEDLLVWDRELELVIEIGDRGLWIGIGS